MDGMRIHAPRPEGRASTDSGFTLIEVMVAMLVLTGGLMSLVGMFALGVTSAAQSTPMMIAREKAREAVESVHSARDTGTLAWNTVFNVSDDPNGVFLDGPQYLKAAGDDGLVNTADDGAIETMESPGPDGIHGTSDDRTTTLSDFKREVAIDTLTLDASAAVNPALRKVTVTVTYKFHGADQHYVLVTYVSSYS
jgi:prepilin-type N-terminal cleavage/methylation domain-containing protein